MTAGGSRAATTITRQPALAPSPQPRPAPTGRALIAQNVGRGGPFWMPIRGPDQTPIDIVGSVELYWPLGTTTPKPNAIERPCMIGSAPEDLGGLTTPKKRDHLRFKIGVAE